jgi:hypothetical protein
MERPAFTRMNLSDVKMIMVIMHVLKEEVLCQVVMGWIPILECMLLLPEDPAPRALTQCQGTLEHGCQGPGHMPSQCLMIRQFRLTSGEILPARGY